MKKEFSLAAFVCAMLLTILAPMTTLAAGGVDEGRFTDFDNLTWTTWDGVSTTYGRGPKFSDVRPDVTDPEYFLKKYNLLSEGTYSPEVVAEIQKFVHSFDWIHFDELTRANMVHDRIGNGCHGNVYEHSTEDYSVLMTGKGTCGNFSGEFRNLARFVGLECELYTPSYLHQACLIKISGQWFATDLTAGQGDGLFLSNATTYPVDYETEYNRYAKESEKKTELLYASDPNNTAYSVAYLNNQLSSGAITREQYEAQCNELQEKVNAMLNNQ